MICFLLYYHLYEKGERFMLLTPDVLFDSYRDITPAFLRQREIGLLLTDLDYTLAPKAVRRPVTRCADGSPPWRTRASRS